MSFSALINGKIQVHPKTEQPTKLWRNIKVKYVVEKITTLPLDTPISPQKVRFVCISDTHNVKNLRPASIPDGDVLLHAGDFSMVGKPEEIESFNRFLGSLPHRHKIVIAGNHDMTFDSQFLKYGSLRRFGLKPSAIYEYLASKGITKMAQVLTNCTAFLEDTETTVCGIRVYGSPWQPWFGGWGFNLKRGEECLRKWDLIPEGIDVLMTHGPPLGHGDFCSSGQRAGCVELLHTVQHRVKPKYHVFGHIHEAYGVTSDGVTTYINASTCTLRYRATNPPIIFDLPLPEGQTKEAVQQNNSLHETLN